MDPASVRLWCSACGRPVRRCRQTPVEGVADDGLHCKGVAGGRQRVFRLRHDGLYERLLSRHRLPSHESQRCLPRSGFQTSDYAFIWADPTEGANCVDCSFHFKPASMESQMTHDNWSGVTAIDPVVLFQVVLFLAISTYRSEPLVAHFFSLSTSFDVDLGAVPADGNGYKDCKDGYGDRSLSLGEVRLCQRKSKNLDHRVEE
jgi:hypothetical protein